MTELALAIIPVGITVTSGLVKYLKAFNDHDDDRARLVRQAERFASTFQSLEAVLKRSQLNRELSISASEACDCLRECQKALEELDTLQQKIFTTTTSAVATTPHGRTKDKIKDGCKKIIYPLRKSDIETLQEALNKLSTTLNIALGMLHLESNPASLPEFFSIYLVKNFAESEFPILRGICGDLSLHRVINGTFVPASIYGQLNAGNDVEDCRDLRFLYPRSLAVIRNNLLEVERLISLHPHILEEVSQYGETPLHIAIYRLDILEALAKKANPENWIQHDNSGATVINLAIKVSHEISTGCPIIPHRDFRCRYDTLGVSFFEASLHCKTLLVKELRSRRRQLRDLARNKLSITEFSKFTPLEEVPDIDAIEMDRLLRQKGILGLGPLSTFVDEDLPQQPYRDVGYYSRSIFFDLGNPEDADLFVDSNFKMICASDDYESSLDRAFFNEHLPWIRYTSLDYAIWLFDHQAPLWKWSYRFTSPMPSIFVLADILGMQDHKCPGQDETNERAEHYLSESDLVDKCSCLCSPDGCTPFTSRMKWLAHPIEQVKDLTPQDYATRFGSHVKIYGRSLNLGHHVIMAIYFLDPVTELEPDEKEFEILNVDAEALNQLEEVVVMFQDFVLTGRQTTISSQSDTFDVDYSAFHEPSTLGIDNLYYQRILEFWELTWVNRMQLSLDNMAKRWDNKLDGLNDLVQISTCEEAMQETRDSLEESDEEQIFNRIIQHIQDI
ncbi:hypothetical protein ACKAV7_013845 [Fusarium commune]